MQPARLFGVMAWLWVVAAAPDLVSADSTFRLQDLDGDGGPEVIVEESLPGGSAAAALAWPSVHRWNGQRFEPSLFPSVYDEFVSAAEQYLQQESQPAEPLLRSLSVGPTSSRAGPTRRATSTRRSWRLPTLPVVSLPPTGSSCSRSPGWRGWTMIQR